MLCRGAKGRGWYKRYLEMGEVGFQKNIPPAPFDWAKTLSVPGAISNSVVFADDAQEGAYSNSRGPEAPNRPKAFFDMAIESDGIGRIVVEVSDSAPCQRIGWQCLSSCACVCVHYSAHSLVACLHVCLSACFIFLGRVSHTCEARVFAPTRVFCSSCAP